MVEASAEWNGWLDELRGQFSIDHETVCIGRHSIELWKPADPESVLDDETLNAAHDELPWQPYWAQAWDSSRGLCQFLTESPLGDLRGQTVLDVGCGIGLTSAWLLAEGAHVVCGDNAPPSLKFARVNTYPWRSRVEVREIDWHQTELDQQFPMIFGSDIVYDRQEVRPLDRFFRRHLADEGRVVLSDPSRPMTREFLQMFRQLGWDLAEENCLVSGQELPTRIVIMQVAERMV